MKNKVKVKGALITHSLHFTIFPVYLKIRFQLPALEKSLFVHTLEIQRDKEQSRGSEGDKEWQKKRAR